MQKLTSQDYKEFYTSSNYGKALENSCPGVRYLPLYKHWLKGKVADLGAGNGDTMRAIQGLGIDCDGYDFIDLDPMVAKADITIPLNMYPYTTSIAIDVMEHIPDASLYGLLANMKRTERQVINTYSGSCKWQGKETHENIKSPEEWEKFISEFLIIKDITHIDEKRTLFLCESYKKKQSDEDELIKYLAGKEIILVGGADSLNIPSDAHKLRISTNGNWLRQQLDPDGVVSVGTVDEEQVKALPHTSCKFWIQRQIPLKPTIPAVMEAMGRWFVEADGGIGHMDEQFINWWEANIPSKHYPLTGVAATIELLRYDISSLYLTGFDFYTTGTMVGNHDIELDKAILKEVGRCDSRVDLSDVRWND